MRLKHVIIKEYKEFFRDKGSLLVVILEPLILMLVFGYAFQADITNLNTLVIDLDNSAYSIPIRDSLTSNDYFKSEAFNGTLAEGKERITSGDTRALFYIPANFSDQLSQAKPAELQIYYDSSDYTVYNLLKGASGEVVKDSLQEIILLIVSDLEEEKETKQLRIDEIQTLVDSIDLQAKDTIDRVERLRTKLDTSRESVFTAEERLENTQSIIKSIGSEASDLSSSIAEPKAALLDLKVHLQDLVSVDPSLAPTIDPIIDSIANMTKDLNSVLTAANKLNPETRIQVSPQYYGLTSIGTQLDQTESEADKIAETANEMEETYRQIQQRMDAIHLELNTLDSEFLSNPIDMKREYLFGEISYFQYLTPAIMSLILFFMGIVLTTVNIVDERNKKTLFRIATTPLSKLELLGGKFIVFFHIGVMETFYVLILGLLLFDVYVEGSIMAVVFVLLLLMAAAIGLGLLISSVMRTMRQALILVPLVIVPSILISQTFSPIEVMPEFMRYFAYLSPMYYSNIALREIMIKGTLIIDVITPVIILFLYGLVTLLLGVLLFKKRID